MSNDLFCLSVPVLILFMLLWCLANDWDRGRNGNGSVKPMLSLYCAS